MTNFRIIPISTIDKKQIIDSITTIGQNSSLDAKSIHLVNAYTCVLFAEMTANNPLIGEHNINLIDGFWLERHLNLKSRKSGLSQIRGPGLFRSFLEQPEAAALKHLFIGSTLANQVLLRKAISTVNPSLQKMEFLCPPFEEMTDQYLDQIVADVKSSAPDIVWVGMGTPKQDYIGSEISSRLGITSICVGAAFDFMAGSVKEAPRFFQKFGIEWLYRLIKEPKRLWKRYLWGNMVFVFLCLKDWTFR